MAAAQSQRQDGLSTTKGNQMKLFTAEQMRLADDRAEAAGIAIGELMEAAGQAVAERLEQLFPAATKVLVLCGKGNNGGDGYVAARYLGDHLVVQVLELSSEPSTPAAAEARAALIASGSSPRPLSLETLRAWLEGSSHDEAEGRHIAQGAEVAATTANRVIVDALLGSGLDRPLRSELAELVELLNASGIPLLAVDVPTGINADSPVPPGPHLLAYATVQLAGAKLASCFYPARTAYAQSRSRPEGRNAVADIGIPSAVLDELSDVTILDDDRCRAYLPYRPPNAHKYLAGTVTVVAGSTRYLGAAELCCRGAWRGGAGLVTLLGIERFAGAWPETIFLQRPEAAVSANPLHSGSESVSSEPAWPPEGLQPRHADATVVGPGLDTASLWLLDTLFAWAPGALVVDATALDPLALWPTLAAAPDGLAARVVLTPHAGEAARLLADARRPATHGAEGAAEGSVSAAEVNADPLGSARELAAGSGAIVVLKGATTVIAEPGGEVAVSCRGHPGMAAGGTGDVLAGLIGALSATAGSQQELFERSCLAVYLHGTAGELAAKRQGNALVADDLVAEIGPALVGLGWGS